MKKKRIFSWLICILIIISVSFAWLHPFPNKISVYLFNYLYSNNKPLFSQTSKDNNNAIFYIIGEEENYPNLFDSYCLNSHHQRLRAQYNAEYRVTKKLSDCWKWDFYAFYGCIPLFNKYEYDTLLVFFHGHGGQKRGKQFFCFKYNFSMNVKTIAKKIHCNNLTVVVTSCYSVNWYEDFSHENLNGLFTCDLKNKICWESAKSYPIPLKLEPQYYPFWYIAESINFNNHFIKALLTGQNYREANTTAYSLYEEQNY